MYFCLFIYLNQDPNKVNTSSWLTCLLDFFQNFTTLFLKQMGYFLLLVPHIIDSLIIHVEFGAHNVSMSSLFSTHLSLEVDSWCNSTVIFLSMSNSSSEVKIHPYTSKSIISSWILFYVTWYYDHCLSYFIMSF
jgi:hypothetical protein